MKQSSRPASRQTIDWTACWAIWCSSAGGTTCISSQTSYNPTAWIILWNAALSGCSFRKLDGTRDCKLKKAYIVFIKQLTGVIQDLKWMEIKLNLLQIGPLTCITGEPVKDTERISAKHEQRNSLRLPQAMVKNDPISTCSSGINGFC